VCVCEGREGGGRGRVRRQIGGEKERKRERKT
jgi:hypothetical protein